MTMSHPLVRPYLTYEALSRLPADGHRYELFDGEAYMCPSPTLLHQKVLGNLYVAFRAGLRDGAEVFIAPTRGPSVFHVVRFVSETRGTSHGDEE